MGFVNKIFLMGNLTRDPELRQLPSGTAVCDFGIATNRSYKTAGGEEKQETVFVECTGFGRTAEVIAEYCPKGRPIFVEGRLHYETWEDKSGGRRSRLTVIVEQFQFVGGRTDGEGQEGTKQKELSLGGSERGNEEPGAGSRGGEKGDSSERRTRGTGKSSSGANRGRTQSREERKGRGGAAVQNADDVDDDLPF